MAPRVDAAAGAARGRPPARRPTRPARRPRLHRHDRKQGEAHVLPVGVQQPQQGREDLEHGDRRQELLAVELQEARHAHLHDVLAVALPRGLRGPRVQARGPRVVRHVERERRRDPAERAVLPPLALHVVVVVHDYLLDAPVVRVGGRRLLLVRLGAPVLVELALVVHDEARAHARAPHRAEGGPPLVLLGEDERVGPVAHLVRLPKPRRRLEGHDPAAHEVVQGVEGQHQE